MTTRWPERTSVVAAAIAGAALAALTLLRFGATANGFVWAATQLLLVFVAAFDLETRRIPNWVTVPAAIVTIVLRAAFAHSTLVETFVAGGVAFAAFLLLALVTRGGFGMGDVKLAGLLGLLLGKAALPGLLVGVVAGGIASTVSLLTHRGERGRTIAYGPYLCLGGAVATLAFAVPRLI